MLLTAIRNLWAHKVRFAASVLSIMLGVALTAGTLMLTSTMRQTYDNLFASVYQGTDAVARTTASVPWYTLANRLSYVWRIVEVSMSVPAVSGHAEHDRENRRREAHLVRPQITDRRQQH